MVQRRDRCWNVKARRARGVSTSKSVLGPVIGGFFAGAGDILGLAGWRWVFLVNLPVGIIALVVVAKVLNVPHNKVNHRVDYWGAAALTVGLPEHEAKLTILSGLRRGANNPRKVQA